MIVPILMLMLLVVVTVEVVLVMIAGMVEVRCMNGCNRKRGWTC
jgi:hypothetical protein